MCQKYVGVLVVMENILFGLCVIGVVMDCDIVFDVVVVGVSLLQICVVDVMSWGIFNVLFEVSLSDVLQEMFLCGVWCVGVMFDGVLVGVLFLDDVFGVMVIEWSFIVWFVYNECECEMIGSVQLLLSV